MSMNTWKVDRCTPLAASLCRVISTVFMQVVKPIKQVSVNVSVRVSNLANQNRDHMADVPRHCQSNNRSDLPIVAYA